MNSYAWVYIPASCYIGDDGFYEFLARGSNSQGKTPYGVLHNKHVSGFRKGLSRFGGGCLRSVHPTNKLYVLAHGPGTHGGGYIGANRFGAMKRYSPSELASLLQAEGLTKYFVDLRIFACRSAFSIGGNIPFAQKLSIEMRERGYNLIKVTGYSGVIKPSYAPRVGGDGLITTTEHKGIYDEDIGNVLPASMRKFTF
jgi:hypothetical protein